MASRSRSAHVQSPCLFAGHRTVHGAKLFRHGTANCVSYLVECTAVCGDQGRNCLIPLRQHFGWRGALALTAECRKPTAPLPATSFCPHETSEDWLNSSVLAPVLQAGRSWLRVFARSLICFSLPRPSSCTMTLGGFSVRTKISTRKCLWAVKRGTGIRGEFARCCGPRFILPPHCALLERNPPNIVWNQKLERGIDRSNKQTACWTRLCKEPSGFRACWTIGTVVAGSRSISRLGSC
jgi:hypothetical protein